MEPISSFAISCAAGIALNLWSKSQQTVDKEIKLAFDDALKDWCPNSNIREKKRDSLKRQFILIAYQPENFSQDYKCYGKYESFYLAFEKRLSQYQVAYNYIKSIQDSTRYLKEIKTLNKVLDKVDDTHVKVTEILETLKPNVSKKTAAKKNVANTNIPVRKILFNNYTEDSEKYYLEREIDEILCVNLDSGNIWLYGFSGIGKTALISRNLIQKSIEFIYCDFSPIEIKSSDDVLNEICFSIEEKYNITLKNDTQNIIKNTCDLLSQIATKEIVIVIDELSITDGKLLKSITENLVKLLNHHCNKTNCTCLRFIASTIEEPIFDYVFSGKAFEYFQFIGINDWSNDLERLLELLVTPLCLNLDDSMKTIIIQNSKSSPRLLKKILRKITTLKNIKIEDIKNISEATRKEHF